MKSNSLRVANVFTGTTTAPIIPAANAHSIHSQEAAESETGVVGSDVHRGLRGVGAPR